MSTPEPTHCAFPSRKAARREAHLISHRATAFRGPDGWYVATKRTPTNHGPDAMVYANGDCEWQSVVGWL